MRCCLKLKLKHCKKVSKDSAFILELGVAMDVQPPEPHRLVLRVGWGVGVGGPGPRGLCLMGLALAVQGLVKNTETG